MPGKDVRWTKPTTPPDGNVNGMEKERSAGWRPRHPLVGCHARDHDALRVESFCPSRARAVCGRPRARARGQLCAVICCRFRNSSCGDVSPAGDAPRSQPSSGGEKTGTGTPCSQKPTHRGIEPPEGVDRAHHRRYREQRPAHAPSVRPKMRRASAGEGRAATLRHPGRQHPVPVARAIETKIAPRLVADDRGRAKSPCER